MTLFTNSIDELEKIASSIIKLFNTTSVFLLSGNLASGKTTLVSEIVKQLGINDSVSSPTFSIINEYGNQEKVYHYDIYQIGSKSFIDSQKWLNLLEDGIHLVEWGDDILMDKLDTVGIKFVVINIREENNKRVYEII